MVRARERCREARGLLGELSIVLGNVANEEVLVNFAHRYSPCPEILMYPTAMRGYCSGRRVERVIQVLEYCAFMMFFCRSSRVDVPECARGCVVVV